MQNEHKKTPDLPLVFLEPKGWQWQTFTRNDRVVRFGFILPEKPKAIIVFLPGLSEFCEKHFETAHAVLEKNYGFFILDWFGQGHSGRYFSDNPHKRHGVDFAEDIADLKEWIDHHIKQKTQAPLCMIALSMGGNIGLHYLYQNPDIFSCATSVCPMFGIKTMRHIPLATHISSILDRFASDSYVPGGGDWKEIMHPPPALSFLSKDPVRNPVHNTWCLADPGLQVGGVTFGWVYAAHQSCQKLKKLDFSNINTPIFVACAHHEMLVDNHAIREICVRLPRVRMTMLNDSWHEPLMERQHIRESFFNKFFNFLEDILKISS